MCYNITTDEEGDRAAEHFRAKCERESAAVVPKGEATWFNRSILDHL